MLCPCAVTGGGAAGAGATGAAVAAVADTMLSCELNTLPDECSARLWLVQGC